MTTATALDTATLYPSLTEMGIVRFHEISHYSVQQNSRDRDVLRVYYKRAKGSLLPFSRKYVFGRSLKTVVADSGTSRFEDTYEISPFLQRAMTELDTLVAENKLEKSELHHDVHGIEHKATILRELNHIERACANDLSPAQSANLAAHFTTIRKELETL